MIKHILTANGQLYHFDVSESELYHYGVPGMKWGQRKIKRLGKAEKRLSKRLVKDERRYQKVLKKYNKAQAKGVSGTRLQNAQFKEQAARAQRNATKAKLDTTRAGLKAANKLIDSYADSPKTVSQLASSAINKGSDRVSKLMRGK